MSGEGRREYSPSIGDFKQQQAPGTDAGWESDRPGEQPDYSELFIVRLWNAPNADPGTWQGRVQHILRGESHSFTGWAQLLRCLEAMLLAEDRPAEGESVGRS